MLERGRAVGRRARPLPGFQELPLNPGAGLPIGGGLDHSGYFPHGAPRRLECEQACLPFSIHASHGVVEPDAQQDGRGGKPAQAPLPGHGRGSDKLAGHGGAHPGRYRRIGPARCQPAQEVFGVVHEGCLANHSLSRPSAVR